MMAKNPDENFDMPGFETGADPFGGGAEGGQDFFDSGEAPLGDESPQPQGVNPPGPAMAQAPLPRQGGVDRKVVNLTSDIPVQIVAVLGKKSVTVKDVVSLRMGQVIELNRLPNEA